MGFSTHRMGAVGCFEDSLHVRCGPHSGHGSVSIDCLLRAESRHRPVSIPATRPPLRPKYRVRRA